MVSGGAGTQPRIVPPPPGGVHLGAAETRGHLKYMEFEEDTDPPAVYTALPGGPVGKKRPLLLSPAWREGASAATELGLMRKLEATPAGSTAELTLRQVRFSQESIKGYFCDGQPVAKMHEELSSGAKTIDDIPRITVVPFGRRAFSHDNRRLWVFKHCGYPRDIRAKVLVSQADDRFFKKLTTPTDGATVRRRGGDCGFPAPPVSVGSAAVSGGA